MKVDTALLRKYLSDKFNVPEFDNFLADYFPLVFNDIPPRMLLSERIEVLLGHCRRDDRYPDLFATLKRERPDFEQNDFTDTPQPAPTPPTLCVEVFREGCDRVPSPCYSFSSVFLWWSDNNRFE